MSLARKAREKCKQLLYGGFQAENATGGSKNYKVKLDRESKNCLRRKNKKITYFLTISEIKLFFRLHRCERGQILEEITKQKNTDMFIIDNRNIFF